MGLRLGLRVASSRSRVSARVSATSVAILTTTLWPLLRRPASRQGRSGCSR